jgi:UDP-N-acetylmuramoylalanine--D-glutamate ligase
MNLESLKNKRICLLGFGIENRALLDFLILKKVKCEIMISDANAVGTGHALFPSNVKIITGKNYDKNLDQFDIIFRIAGYPLFSKELLKAKKKGVAISSATKLFFDLCPTKNIIGVTGTKGKGTTSSLIAHILKSSKKRVFFGGNIGTPMFSFLNKIKQSDYVVLELSSFQLEDLEVSPHISVITNFTPEHLAPADPKNPNYHKSLKDYWKAKINIFRWQDKNNYLVVNEILKSKIINLKLKNKKIFFNTSDLKSNLVGEYNKQNIAAAVEMAKTLKIKKEIIAKAVSSFHGLPHRIEFVREHKGVKYFDNSFATTPESTIEDLKSFSEPIILFLGGSDKGSDFSELVKVVGQKVKFVVLLDVTLGTKRIEKELYKIKYPKEKMMFAKSMEKGVDIAYKNSEPGDVVLLSTACASFGIFKNYKERGDLFKKFVNEL